MTDEEHPDPHTALYMRIRPLCGFGPQAEQTARAIVALFTVVEYRDHDLDVTALSDSRRQLLRQRWLVAAVADGPARTVDGGPNGILEPWRSTEGAAHEH